MTGFHVKVEPCLMGGFQAIDHNRFDSVDEGGYTGYGIGDTPEEACQSLIDGNKPTLLDYIKDLIKSHDLSFGQQKCMYESAMWAYFDLYKAIGDENPEGATLVHCIKLATAFVTPAETGKEVAA